MVAVRNQEADSFLARLSSTIFLYLFFGEDEGLISERSSLVLNQTGVNPKDPFQLMSFEGDALVQEPSLLFDEVQALGLFQARRVIRIHVGSRNLVPVFQALLDPSSPPLSQGQTLLLVEAGPLRRDAALRLFFERQPLAAAIECALDTEESLRTLLQTQLAAHHLTITEEARDLLLTLLGQNRLTTRSEIEKLILYCQGQSVIQREDVEAISTDAALTQTYGLFAACFSGHVRQTHQECLKIWSAGFEPSFVLSQALRQALLLHRACADHEAGLSPERAFEKTGQKLPLSARKLFISYISLWRVAVLGRVIERLTETLKHIRLSPHQAEVLTMRALWFVAQMLQSQGARQKVLSSSSL